MILFANIFESHIEQLHNVIRWIIPNYYYMNRKMWTSFGRLL